MRVKSSRKSLSKSLPMKSTEPYPVNMMIFGANGTQSFLLIPMPLQKPARKQLLSLIGELTESLSS